MVSIVGSLAYQLYQSYQSVIPVSWYKSAMAPAAVNPRILIRNYTQTYNTMRELYLQLLNLDDWSNLPVHKKGSLRIAGLPFLFTS